MMSSLRPRLEQAAHAAALVVLVWALVLMLRPRPTASAVVAGEASVETLARWSTGAAPSRAHATLADAPAPLERTWLAAIAASGTPVSWSADSLRPIAAGMERLADPRGGHRVRIAAPTGVRVLLADVAGPIDTLGVTGAGAVLATQTAVGDVLVRPVAGRGVALAGEARAADQAIGETGNSAGVDRSLPGVLVLGGAGWESRFVIAALEEAGWRISARLAVAPDTWVEQGTIGAIDTARFGAVVVLDTTAARWAPEIARFASRGGGVVLAGTAARLSALRQIAPGRIGRYVPAGPGTPPDSAPRRGLGLHPIDVGAADALVLEQRGSAVAVAARRHLLGRVVQIGYDDTWRWRMGGGEEAPEGHRWWWSRLVGGVVYAPAPGLPSRSPVDSLDAAPVARLWQELGPPAAAPAVVDARRSGVPWWMLPLATALLLASWGSRRLRGAP